MTDPPRAKPLPEGFIEGMLIILISLTCQGALCFIVGHTLRGFACLAAFGVLFFWLEPRVEAQADLIWYEARSTSLHSDTKGLTEDR